MLFLCGSGYVGRSYSPGSADPYCEYTFLHGFSRQPALPELSGDKSAGQENQCASRSRSGEQNPARVPYFKNRVH